MMSRVLLLIFLIAAAWLTGCVRPQDTGASGTDVIKLPPPAHDGNMSVEAAMLNRRSIREYSEGPLTLREVSQLLWAAQGIAGPGRTAPSAGALYPLEVYAVVGNVEGISPGVYKYRPGGHELFKAIEGDKRGALCDAALGQASVKNGALDIVIAGVYERTTGKYGESGIKYVHMEAGHAAQNVYLQATSLRLGTVSIGAFSEDGVRKAIGMRGDERPLYIMPVGRE